MPLTFHKVIKVGATPKVNVCTSACRCKLCVCLCVCVREYALSQLNFSHLHFTPVHVKS